MKISIFLFDLMARLNLGYMSEEGEDSIFFNSYILEKLLHFFNQGGDESSLNQLMKSHDYKILESEFRLRSAPTSDLVKLFYLQVQKFKLNSMHEQKPASRRGDDERRYRCGRF